jgi:thiol-disulfide isomerase/thioredoxin
MSPIWAALASTVLAFSAGLQNRAQDKEPPPAQMNEEDEAGPQLTTPLTSQPATHPQTRPARQRAYEFQAMAVSGATIDFPAMFRGKLVLVTFWSTTCKHSREELPVWLKIYEMYHDQGFEIVGVMMDKTKPKPLDKVLKFLTHWKIGWENIYDDSASIAPFFDVDGIPMSFLVDGDTGIILQHGNPLRGPQLIRKIAKHLKWKEDRTARAATSQPASQPAGPEAPVPPRAADAKNGRPAEAPPKP